MAKQVQIAVLDDGVLWRVTFGSAKGNVLDCAAMTALTNVFKRAGLDRRVKAICLEGVGSDFSFGASVQEHLPGDVADMLARMRDLTFAVLDSCVVTGAVVRGQCLGGGLELAALCHRIFAHADARLGQPEIKLGVFAPVASLVLPGRIGRAHAEDLCLTGRTVSAAEAHAMGLVDVVTDQDPIEPALKWMREQISPHSPATLRIAVKAIRAPLARKIREELPEVERLYLDELMASPDAVEGLRAFLEKRRPQWRT